MILWKNAFGVKSRKNTSKPFNKAWDLANGGSFCAARPKSEKGPDVSFTENEDPDQEIEEPVI